MQVEFCGKQAANKMVIWLKRPVKKRDLFSGKTGLKWRRTKFET